MIKPLSPSDSARINDALFQGRKIEAIKIHREVTGSGLKEAKDAVEDLEKQLRAATPERFAKPAAGKGCAGVFVVLCGMVIGLVYLWSRWR